MEVSGEGTLGEVVRERDEAPGGPPSDALTCEVVVEGGPPPEPREERARVRPFLQVAHPRAHVGAPCHGQPARAEVHLQVQGPFEGQGTLSWAPLDALRAYEAREGGEPLDLVTYGAEALRTGRTVYLAAVPDAAAWVKRVALTFRTGEGPDQTGAVTWLSPPAEEEELVSLFADGQDRVDVPARALGGPGAPEFVEQCGGLAEALRALRGLHGEGEHRLSPLFCCGLGDLAGLLVRTCRRWLEGHLDRSGAVPVRNQVRSNHLGAVKKLRKRLLSYLDTLGPVFADCEAAAACVLRARPSGSDSHKKGQQVFVLDLGVAGVDGRRAAKVVYKPRDERLSYALLGDTSRVVLDGARYVASSGADDGRRRRSAAELLNGWLEDAGSSVRLSTLRVLPGAPDPDRLRGDPSKAVRSSFGFVEFVACDLEGRTVENPEDRRLGEYFSAYGALCGLAHLFAIDDLHFENVRLRAHRPVATDVEICLRSARRATLNNGLLTPTIGPPFITRVHWKGLRSPAVATSRLFFKDGAPVELHENQRACAALIAGYAEVLEAAGPHAAELVKGIEAHFPLMVRVLTRRTSVYDQRLERFVRAWLEQGTLDAAWKQVDAAFVDADLEALGGLLAEAFQSFKESSERREAAMFVRDELNGWWPTDLLEAKEPLAIFRAVQKVFQRAPEVAADRSEPCPLWALEEQDHDRADYARLDYPAYYADPTQIDVYNARGRPVRVRDKQATVFVRALWTARCDELLALAGKERRQAAVEQLENDLSSALKHYQDVTLVKAKGTVLEPGQ